MRSGHRRFNKYTGTRITASDPSVPKAQNTDKENNNYCLSKKCNVRLAIQTNNVVNSVAPLRNWKSVTP